MGSEELLLEPGDGWQRAATISSLEPLSPRDVSLLSPCCWSELPGHLQACGEHGTGCCLGGLAPCCSETEMVMSLESVGDTRARCLWCSEWLGHQVGGGCY